MMCFPTMLVTACGPANIPVPDEQELEIYSSSKDEAERMLIADKYPHFHIFCTLQLGRAIQWGEHWENAKIIGQIPVKRLKTMTFNDFRELGVYP